MMRTLFLLVALLTGCANAPPNVSDMVGDQVVIAKLDEPLGLNFGCGGIVAYGAATYTVVDGPRSLLGKQINVLVYCLDESKHGSTNFTMGRKYRLLLTKVMPYRSDVDQPLGPSPYRFYLRGDPEPVTQ